MHNQPVDLFRIQLQCVMTFTPYRGFRYTGIRFIVQCIFCDFFRNIVRYLRDFVTRGAWYNEVPLHTRGSNMHLATSCYRKLFETRFLSRYTRFLKTSCASTYNQLTISFCFREGYASIPQGHLTYLAPELMRTLTRKGCVLSPEERNTEFSNVYAYR